MNRKVNKGLLPTARQAATTVSYVLALLRSPVTLDQARANVRARLADRPGAFLETLERAVFAYPEGAYRHLLTAAGYDFPRVRALILDRGVEGALAQLHADGVYVSIEEFKGLREARRGDRVFRFTERHFRNPLVRSGLPASSGGTRGPTLWNTIPLSNHRMGAEHLALALDAYGILDAPLAVWLAHPHGASTWAVLALAALGNPPRRWFTHVALGPRTGRAGVLSQILRHTARLRRAMLPPTTYVPLGREAEILRWISRVGPRCGLLTTPSLALRLTLAARGAGRDLRGLTFITIAEPLTPAKLHRIREAGARAFSSLGFTEFGRATYGCAAADADEGHVAADALAILRVPRTVDRLGTTVEALQFTSLRPDARRILLNTETGDYAHAPGPGCGCLLEQAGWRDRLSHIRSFEKLNAEGRLFYGTRLIELVEEVLPRRFGGDPTDYQLLEHEDDAGFTRLSVLVHPRLGPLDEEALGRAVDDTLAGWHRASAEVWREAGTVRVERRAPLLTVAGKLMPLHHLT